MKRANWQLDGIDKLEDGEYLMNFTIEYRWWFRKKTSPISVRGSGGCWSYYPSGMRVTAGVVIEVIRPALQRYLWSKTPLARNAAIGDHDD